VARGPVALACALALTFPGAVVADEPDLVLRLPQAPYAGQVAPVYVDRYEQPGRVLYRFDAVIHNQGGTLDVFRDGHDRPATQAIWSGGRPPAGSEPVAGAAPSPSADVTLVDRASAGASFSYVMEPDHAHWHVSQIARYELLVPGEPPRVSDKIGFCFFDGFDIGGVVTYFPEPDWASGDPTWCAFDAPGAGVVRMGLSPGASDRYRSQRHWQWVDVTGLAAGDYELRGIANPAGYVVESDTGNNILSERRVIPGATARPAVLETAPGQAVTGELRGSVAAPEVPARRSAACEPGPVAPDCYVHIGPGAPLRFEVAEQPRHGQVTVEPAGNQTAVARYTPDPGFTGGDRFTYTVTDERELRSAPATVAIAVRAEQRSAPVTPATPAAPGAPASRLRLRRIGKRWYAILRVHARCRVGGTLRRSGRIVRRLAPRRRAPRRRTVALGILDRPGRYSLRLSARRGEKVVTLRARMRLRGTRPG
jgi:hypothetical protein